MNDEINDEINRRRDSMDAEAYCIAKDMYLQYLKRINRGLSSRAMQEEASLFRNIMIAASSMLGIVAALHTTNSTTLYIRLAFSLSLVLFALGILLAGSVLYIHANYSKRVLRGHSDRIQQLEADDEGEGTSPRKRKLYPWYHRWCVTATYISLIGALLLLTIYAVLSSLIGI